MTIKEEFERYDRSPKIYLVGVDYYNPDLGSLWNAGSFPMAVYTDKEAAEKYYEDLKDYNDEKHKAYMAEMADGCEGMLTNICGAHVHPTRPNFFNKKF